MSLSRDLLCQGFENEEIEMEDYLECKASRGYIRNWCDTCGGECETEAEYYDKLEEDEE